MSADVISALIAILKADAGVAALAGDRIFGEELPPKEAESMPRKCVVLQPSGGVPLTGGYLEVDTQRVDARCYGETRREASKLRMAVHLCLKQVSRVTAQTADGGVLVHWVRDAGGFLTGRDPDGDWPLAWRTYQAHYAEQLTAA